MTTKAITPGPQFSFPVLNGYAPKQGPRALQVILDFSTDDTIIIDFSEAQQADAISYIQSMFVDNSDNPNALTFVWDVTGQRVVCPANSQGTYPVIATVVSKCTVTTNVGIKPSVHFLNVPLPFTEWGPISVVANVNTTPLQGNMVNRGGVITAGGTSQVLAAANANRRRLVVENPVGNLESIFINFGAPAVADNTSFEVAPGGYFDTGPGPVSAEAVNIIAATTGTTYVAKEI